MELHYPSPRSLMNPLSDMFASLYVAAAVIASIGVFMRFMPGHSSGRKLASSGLIAPLVILYLVGMHRTAGEDYENYYSAYNQLGVLIPDLGYTAMTWLTWKAGLSFDNFLFLEGLLSLAALCVAARHKNADAWVVVAIYLMHLAIGRDLSQMRIGLAVAIYFLGQTREKAWLRALLYIFSASIHITVIVLMAVWTYSRMTARIAPQKRKWLIYLPLILFAAGGSVLLDIASLVDPRVEIYLSWDDEGFGAPLSSYGALARSAVVMAVLWAASKRYKALNARPYLTTELAGVAILLAFSQFAIFASRLSNVAISMYPIGLGLVAMACQTDITRRRSRSYGLGVKAAIVATMTIVLARPGSFEALAKVVPTAFEAADQLD